MSIKVILLLLVVVVFIIAYKAKNISPSLGILPSTPVDRKKRPVQSFEPSQKLIDLIKRHEGLYSSRPDQLKPVSHNAPDDTRVYVYNDPIGILTIGYGHTKTANVGMDITKSYAELLLKEDLKSAVSDVKRLVKVDVTQGNFDALVSFTFNLGAGNLSTLINNPGRLNDGGENATAQAIKLYNRAGGKVLAGLTKRRKEESELFLS